MEFNLLKSLNERELGDVDVEVFHGSPQSRPLYVSSKKHGGKSSQTKSLILKTIKKAPLSLEYVDVEFFKDTVFMAKVYKIVLKKNGLALQWVKPQTEEWVKLALKTSPGAKMFVDDKFKHLIP